LKIEPRSSWGMPMPVSDTVRTISPSACRRLTRALPPSRL